SHLFDATVDGSTITVTPPSTLPAYTAFSTGKGSITPVAGQFTYSDTFWAKLVLNLSTSTPIGPGKAWVLKLNTGTGSASAVQYTFIAGQYGETTLHAPIDVRVADDEAPGVLVVQPTGSTNTIEPSSFIVLGDG